MARKNEATLMYKGKQFQLWQNEDNQWVYTFELLKEVNTFSKELQQALNIVHETIDDAAPRRQPPSKNTGRQHGVTTR